MRSLALACTVLMCAACAHDTPARTGGGCEVALIVLGVAQDGGKPQIANPGDAAWTDSSQRRLATSLALVDARVGMTRRWLFDATPDIKAQLQTLDRLAPVARAVGLDGIFLTHAHIGHYTGLMMLGHEAAGARAVPVYAMSRMHEFLSINGPWEQLVRYSNIVLERLTDGDAVAVGADIRVTPFRVPHRQEYSEVVGYRIDGPSRSALYLPDIDSWEEWDEQGTRIEHVLATVYKAFLDATFFANGEIPGRDMSGFPHPFVRHSMARFAGLPAREKDKVHFIHLNHTNPINDAESDEHRAVIKAGFHVAREESSHCL